MWTCNIVARTDHVARLYPPFVLALSRQENGRELARDIKRKALKRKKSRIEEKLDIAKEKVKRREALLSVLFTLQRTKQR